MRSRYKDASLPALEANCKILLVQWLFCCSPERAEKYNPVDSNDVDISISDYEGFIFALTLRARREEIWEMVSERIQDEHHCYFDAEFREPNMTRNSE